jgi:hypothetical protein
MVPNDQSPPARPGPDRPESPDQRADRNFDELLQESRVVQTGVQILFAFLLTLPFQQRFSTVDGFQRGIYVITLLLCAAATALLIAPVAYHRVLFGRHRKPQLVASANRLTRAGLLMLLLALVAGVMMILDVVLGRVAAIGGAVGVAALFVFLWYVLPHRRARQSGDTP